MTKKSDGKSPDWMSVLLPTPEERKASIMTLLHSIRTYETIPSRIAFAVTIENECLPTLDLKKAGKMWKDFLIAENPNNAQFIKADAGASKPSAQQPIFVPIVVEDPTPAQTATALKVFRNHQPHLRTDPWPKPFGYA